MQERRRFIKQSIAFLIGLVFLLGSCGVRKQAGDNEQVMIAITPEELLDNFSNAHSESIPWQTTGTLSLQTQGYAVDLRADVSLYPQYGMFLSLRPLPFYEVARLYLLPEGITIVDMHNKQYFSSSYNELSEQVHFPISYNLIESLILGECPKEYEEMQLLKDGRVKVILPSETLSLIYKLNDLFRPNEVSTYPDVEGYYANAVFNTYSAQMSNALPTDIKLQIIKSGRVELQLHYFGRSPKRTTKAAEKLSPRIPHTYTRLEASTIQRLLQSLIH